MYSGNRFFATVPTTTLADDVDSSEKLDLLLAEVREQKQSLKFVQEQCDQVLSFVDTIVRYRVLFVSLLNNFTIVDRLMK